MSTATMAHGDTESLERSTLSAAESKVDRVQRDVVEFAQCVRDAFFATLSAVAAAEPHLKDDLDEASEALYVLTHNYQARYGRAPPSKGQHAFDGPLHQWIATAKSVSDQLKTTKIPLRSQKQQNQQRDFSSTVSNLLAGLERTRHEFIRTAYATFSRKVVPEASAELDCHVGQLDIFLEKMEVPPSVVGDMGDGALATHPVPGIGRLRLLAGFAALSELQLNLRGPGGYPGSSNEFTTSVPTRSFAFPLFVDLDRDGGLVTTENSVVEGLILRLLALLPAGQIKLTLFDPAKLGASAEFLFGLGEAAPSIIGDKVKSTDRELNETLLELEEHITFVTQKYLQGTYQSLTEYNVAAGEIAEPYRVLVLYDYPGGFVRSSGQPDDDALARLTKIVQAGPHCGVFTLVALVSPDVPGTTLVPLQSLLSLVPDQLLESGPLNLLAVGQPDVELPSLAITNRNPASRFVHGSVATWHYRPAEPVPKSVQQDVLALVERGLSRAADVQVTASQVATLSRARLAHRMERGVEEFNTLPDPMDESTWWRGSSLDSVSADFGRVGASDVATLTFDSKTFSGALVGGRPGSGKSMLLHAIISSLSMRYPPSEVEFYLVDFKEGVEFKVYASGELPHAKVVAIESEREFGVSVLESLDAEISRRGLLFRQGTGEELNLGTYRLRTGENLPRIILIIDEFHVLFERDDKIASRAAELLDRIVRQGRAFGVHAILASQTLAGTAALGKHTLNQVPIRISLQSSEVDSRLLLGDDNPDARLLTRSGEGVLNTANGLRDANRRFQATYSTGEDRLTNVTLLVARARSEGVINRPVVFEGRRPVLTTDVPDRVFINRADETTLRVPFGLPLTLGEPVTALLRREPGGNLLILADEVQAYAALSVAVATLAGQCTLRVLDFGATDAPWSQLLESMSNGIVEVDRARQAAGILDSLANLVSERLSLQDYKAKPVVLVICGMHRAREFDADEESEPSAALERILKDGPDVGIHVVLWCDRVVSLRRRISSIALREFGLRLVGPMSKEDSFSMVDAEYAAQIDDSQMIFDDHDRSQTVRLRRFSQPDAAWVSRIVSAAQ